MPPSLKPFDRVADCYDATRALPPEVETAATQGIMRALHEVAGQPAVLEVGIGTGRIAVPLTAAGARVVGTDIAPAMLAHLRAKRADIPVVLAEATRLPFRDRPFDGALFVHVLHLLPDARAALAAATAVVRPHGLLLYGRTAHTEPSRRGLLRQARAIVREITGMDLTGGDWHREADRAFAEHARDTGARVSELPLASWREPRTGRQMLDAISGRVYSSTWEIPDSAMPQLLSRLTTWAESVLGDLDRPIEEEIEIKLVTARLPG